MLNARRPGISSAVVLLSASSAVLAAACAPTASPDSTGVSVPTNSLVASSSSVGPASAAACPPPVQTEMACAAVMVSVKVNGLCCTYGSPCAAPPGEQFSDDKCTQSNTIPPKKAPSTSVPLSSASAGATRKPLATRGQPCDLDTTPCAPGLKCFVEPMLPTRGGTCR